MTNRILTLVAALALAGVVAGCATLATPRLAYTNEVRKQSATNDRLFHDLLVMIGGVGRADQAAFPNAKVRTIAHIEVILPYDREKTGSERWTIEHDGGQKAVYQVSLIPDGEGAADFTVSREP